MRQEQVVSVPNGGQQHVAEAGLLHRGNYPSIILLNRYTRVVFWTSSSKATATDDVRTYMDDDFMTPMDHYVDQDFDVPNTSTYAVELEAKVRATLAMEHMAGVLERIASSLEQG